MARYIIIYDDPDAIERTVFFEGSLKALRDYLDKICLGDAPGLQASAVGSGDKEVTWMATREELFAAVRLIKEHCDSMAEKACRDCPLQAVCNRCFIGIPDEWPDPAEGGSEEG